MTSLELGADSNLDPSRRPRHGWGSRTTRTEASRKVRAANTHLLGTASRPFPKCLLERVFEREQRYTLAPTVRQVTFGVRSTLANASPRTWPETAGATTPRKIGRAHV